MAERVWSDLGFYCLAEPEGKYALRVQVWSLVRQEPGEVPDFDCEEGRFLSARFKWDGCSDVSFAGMLHFCEREHLANVGVLLGRLYDLAAELIPRWDG